MRGRLGMERWAPLVARIRPYSFAAVVLALACVVVATILRIAVSWLGVSLLFATYFPAVMVAALLAGTPAGILAIIGAIFVAWWAFIPPFYAFEPLTLEDIANISLFALSSGCIVALAHLYRNVLHRSQERERERELLMQELEHRGRNTYAVVEAIV